jgi:hypothetical protein
MRGEMEPPAGVSRARLRLAFEGNPKTGERVPLTFPDEASYHAFQAELRAVFASEGITDAVVQQVGSATKGYKGNPNKPFGPWSPKSDADFAVFSRQALVQAQAVDAKVNTNPKVTLDGRYTVLKNTGEAGRAGFGDTPLGRKLDQLSRKWTERLWPDADKPMVDFKLNLSDAPFSGATTVVDMGGK